MARVPGYRLHKPSGLAFIEIRGKRHYLGKFDTPESRAKYRTMLAEHLAGVPVTPANVDPGEPFTIDDLALEFMPFVRSRYVKNGRHTSEVRSFATALKPVVDLYGDLPAEEFGPKKLAVVRKHLLDKGYCRKRVNGLVSRIRSCWKWGVAQELVPVTTWRALCSLTGLRSGEAPDRPPVKPVDLANVEAIKGKISPVLWGLIQFQLHAGCRPGEACSVRMCDLKMTGDVWEFCPGSHKTEHHGKQRVIYIGPRGQEALRPFLRTGTHVPLFQPCESREWYLKQRRKPGNERIGSKGRKGAKGKRRPGTRYTADSMGKAIRKACRAAGVPEWSPNRLRHSAATLIQSKFDLESARCVLGHSSVSTTEIYADADRKKAREIMKQLG